MPKSLFRRFPSDDLESELPEWEGVNVDGQTFIRVGVGAAGADVAEDFWEAATGGPVISPWYAYAQQ